MKLDHVAIAVSDLEAAIEAFRDKLGLELERVEHVDSEGARVAFFPIGDAHLELVSPARPDASIARSIEKRGEGLHHVCFEVTDVVSEMERLTSRGVTMTNTKPTPGAGGSRVAFVHPKSMNGVLVELVEKPKSAC
ncbi:MAG: methylmalonyl-CoA epimerase [Deltaproteobacteria bacterium]|nr:methylmalonyl-CoA epimerase [Deltaproteobacteria bacterium]